MMSVVYDLPKFDILFTIHFGGWNARSEYNHAVSAS